MGLLDFFRKKPKVELQPASPNPLISRLLYFYQYGRELVSEENLESQLRAYRSWVYDASNLNAQSVAQVPLRLYVAKPSRNLKSRFPTREVSKEQKDFLYKQCRIWKYSCVRKAVDIEEVIEHPLFDLFKNVNNFNNSFDLWEMTQLHQELTGNAYWFLVGGKDFNTPVEIWTIPPERCSPIPDPRTFISAYQYKYGTLEYKFDESEVIHFKFPNPRNPYLGISPLIAAASAYTINENMARYEQAIFKNMGKLSGAFTTKESIDEDDWVRLKQELQEAYGGMDNAGKTALLDKGLEYKDFGMTPTDLSFIEGRRLIREEILNCFIPNTGIITNTGVVSIENIKIGDRVLTHNGRFRKVRKIMSRDYSGEVITIKAKGLESITGTPNHPFLCSYDYSSNVGERLVGEKYDWKEMSKIVMREKNPKKSPHYIPGFFDNLSFPKISIENTIHNLDILDFYTDDDIILGNGTVSIANYNANKVKRIISINATLGRLIGLYLAEGCVGDGRQILFYFHDKEEEYREFIVKAFKDIFGIDAFISKKKESKVTFVRCTNKIVSAFFKQFGDNAKNKFIPEWIFHTNKEFWESLIQGISEGDGCIRNNGSIDLASASWSMIWQIRLMLLSLGEYAGITKKTQVSFITESGPNKLYYLRWYQGKKNYAFYDNEKYFKFFVKEKVSSNYEGKVYNLSIEEDESYVTVGGTVHNCFGQNIALYSENPNRANADAAERAYMRRTVRPRCIRLAEKLNEKLCPRYDENLFIAFEDPSPEDILTRARVAEMSIRMGRSTINEERLKERQPPVKGGDEPLVQSQYIPLSLASTGAALRQGTPPNSGQPREGREPEKSIEEVSEVIAGMIRRRLNDEN